MEDSDQTASEGEGGGVVPTTASLLSGTANFDGILRGLTDSSRSGVTGTKIIVAPGAGTSPLARCFGGPELSMTDNGRYCLAFGGKLVEIANGSNDVAVALAASDICSGIIAQSGGVFAIALPHNKTII